MLSAYLRAILAWPLFPAIKCLALTENARHLLQLADIPVIIDPILKRELPLHLTHHLLVATESYLWLTNAKRSG
jgi:hypothetical protein